MKVKRDIWLEKQRLPSQERAYAPLLDIGLTKAMSYLCLGQRTNVG